MISLSSQKVKMSDAIHDMTAYSRLTDAVLHQIMVSDGQELEEVDLSHSVCKSSILFSHSLESYC